MNSPVAPTGYTDYGPSAEAGSPWHISDYVRILYKRRWSAAAVFLAFVASGAYGSLRRMPVYQAVATVQIEPDVTRPSSIGSVLQDQGYADETFYDTEYQILRSRGLAWRAIQAMHLDGDLHAPPRPMPAPPPPSLKQQAMDWVMNLVGAPKVIPPPPPDETTAQASLISGFLGGLSVDPVRETHLVDLRYTSADPVFAAAAANAVAEQYKARSQEQRVQISQETTTWLDQELAQQKQKMDASDAALQQYKETHDAAVSLGSGQNIVVQRLSDLAAQATKAKIDRFNKESVYQQVVQADQKGTRQALLAVPAVASNDAVQKAQDAVDDLLTTRSKMSTRYLDSMPEMIDINSQIKAAQTRLDAVIRGVVDGVKADYQAALDTEAQLSKALDAQKAETLGLNREGLSYANLLSDAQSNHEIYDNLLQRAKETTITGNYKGSNIQIIDKADVPRSPSSFTSHDITTAAFEGLLFALGLALVLEYVDNRIVSPDEIKDRLGLPFLGLIPEVRPGRLANGDRPKIPLISGSVPQGFGEAVRAIRTAVIYSSPEEGARSIVISSTAPSEGKTVVAANLAIALAQTEQPTLLIDGDMRRPQVHEAFGRAQEPGLSDVLVGAADQKEAIQPTHVAHLSVLPAGHLPPNPVELLASNRYRQFIDSLRHEFAWIVIDAPPALAVTDAAVIAHDASGVVFVVGAEMTPRRNAMTAIERLNAAKVRFIGAVLNRVDLRSQGYYYSPYYRKDYTRVYERTN